MLIGREVVLTYKKNERKDKYGRTLAYVWLDVDWDGRLDLFNLVLIEQGCAKAYTQFPFELKGEFASAERQAKRDKRGLWGACLNKAE